MKIVLCHNRYQQQGGEDAVVNAELELLRSKGHTVALYEVTNDSLSSPLQKLAAGLSVSYSHSAGRKLKLFLESFKPDVVHFHNIFPLLTPAAYDACRELNIPVIQTLHNYRNICANGLLARDSKPCEKCITGSPMHGVQHACYRQSRLQSLAVARMIQTHRSRDSWNHKVDQFVALTEFARDKFTQAGFKADKINIKPNFVSTTERAESSPHLPEQPYAIFVGRLSEEKGIHTLIRAWQDMPANLLVVGDGPLLNQLQAEASDQISFTGRLESKELNLLVHHAQLLIAPSECYETFGMVVVEAYAQGTAVLCSQPGSMQELIIENETGLTFRAGDMTDLRSKAQHLLSDQEAIATMGHAAEACYQSRYTAEANYSQLLNIYQKAIEDHA